MRIRKKIYIYNKLTSGMAYTKLPIGLTGPDDSPGVDAVTNTITHVSSEVKCTWAVVCRALGTGNESSLGCS